MHSVTLLVN